MSETQRESSRREWKSDCNTEDINSGSLQRIADAVEKMAQSNEEVRKERDAAIQKRDEYASLHCDEWAAHEATKRSLSATRGCVTRLKRRIDELEAALAPEAD